MKKMLLLIACMTVAGMLQGCSKNKESATCGIGSEIKEFDRRYGKPKDKGTEEDGVKWRTYFVDDYRIGVLFQDGKSADRIWYSRVDGKILSAKEIQKMLELCAEGKEWKTAMIPGYWYRSDGIVEASIEGRHYIDGNENLIREDADPDEDPCFWSMLVVEYVDHISIDRADVHQRDTSGL